MKKALLVFACVMLGVTCFDLFAWVMDARCRTFDAETRKVLMTKARMVATGNAFSLYMSIYGSMPEKPVKLLPIDSRLFQNVDNYNKSRLATACFLERTDEWGNDFRIERKGKVYRLVSAGPDGEFETDDDLKYLIRVEGEKTH